MIETLKSFLTEALPAYDVPGAAVALVRGDDVLMAEGFGHKDNGQAITPDTLFRVGGLTKSMTALMIAALVDAGVLSWDQRVVEIWPDFSLADASLTQSVCLRDLMDMGLGLAPTCYLLHAAETLGRKILDVVADIPAMAAPGQRYIYHDELFAAAGLIAALAVGAKPSTAMDTYQTLMYKHVLQPIGMGFSTFLADLRLLSDDYARSYEYNPATGRLEAVPYGDIGGEIPAAGVASSAWCMAHYMMTQLNGGVTPKGQRVASRLNVHETWKPQTPMADGSHYALGWVRGQRNGRDALWHRGRIDGFVTDTLLLPDEKLGLTIMSNASTATYLHDAALDIFTGRADASQHHAAYQQFKARFDELRQVAPPINPKPYLGRYEHYLRLQQREDESLWFVPWAQQRQLLPLGTASFALQMHGRRFQLDVNEQNGTPAMQFTDMETGLPRHGTFKKLR